MSYQIKLESYEGPFDLLLHLIDKNEVDIYDIPIAKIAEQYVEYLEKMESLDLEIASEFLVMAARLLYLKAKSLLPPTEDEETQLVFEELDSEERLLQDILAYKQIKEAASMFENMAEQRNLIYSRPNNEEMYVEYFSYKHPLEGKTLDDLGRAFGKVYKRAKDRDLVMSIKGSGITITDMMEDIREQLKIHPKGIEFSDLFQNDKSKYQLVLRFLALLELMKISVIRVYQEESFGKIFIFPMNLEKNIEAVEI